MERRAILEWSWWPSADGAVWAWSWRAYPGVWLSVLALGGVYVTGLLRARRRLSMEVSSTPPSRRWLFATGLLLFWLACDWPAGALAGQLVVFHAIQYLLVSLGAAPLMLLGTPAESLPRLSRRLRWVAGRVARPAGAATVFAAALLLTHLPGAVDALRPEPVGSFAITAGWLAAALIYWWPMVGPERRQRRLPYLASVAYLLFPFILPKVPGAFFIFSSEPLYEVYASASRVWELAPEVDQQLAGLLLWVAGSVMVVAALAALFFTWAAEDRRITDAAGLAVPANPRAIGLLFEAPGAWAALERLIAIVESALPSSSTGVELNFAFREPADAPVQVVLELHIAVDGDANDEVAARIAAEYEAFLSGVGPGERSTIRRRLAFRVVGYGSRIS